MLIGHAAASPGGHASDSATASDVTAASSAVASSNASSSAVLTDTAAAVLPIGTVVIPFTRLTVVPKHIFALGPGTGVETLSVQIKHTVVESVAASAATTLSTPAVVVVIPSTRVTVLPTQTVVGTGAAAQTSSVQFTSTVVDSISCDPLSLSRLGGSH
jgi:hypothetical protein